MVPNLNFSKLWSIRLAVVCTIVFALQAIIPSTDSLALVSAAALSHPWTVLTYIFLHGGVTHLLYNMFALLLFGTILESILGPKRFLQIFFVAGILAGISAIPFYSAVVGASGAIYGVMGCLAVLRPRMIVWVWGVPMPMIIALGVWTLVDSVGAFSTMSETAHISHLAGLAVGVAVGVYFWK
ncbi:MAG: rhomboid family intramembrane serine protease [archaeon]